MIAFAKLLLFIYFTFVSIKWAQTLTYTVHTHAKDKEIYKSYEINVRFMFCLIKIQTTPIVMADGVKQHKHKVNTIDFQININYTVYTSMFLKHDTHNMFYISKIKKIPNCKL